MFATTLTATHTCPLHHSVRYQSKRPGEIQKYCQRLQESPRHAQAPRFSCHTWMSWSWQHLWVYTYLLLPDPQNLPAQASLIYYFSLVCVINIFYKTSSGCQISFLANKIFSSASERSSFSASTTRCHCDQRIASRYLLMRSTVADLSRMITRPIGLRILSISSNRSSVLHPAFSISENTFHACRRS